MARAGDNTVTAARAIYRKAELGSSTSNFAEGKELLGFSAKFLMGNIDW